MLKVFKLSALVSALVLSGCAAVNTVAIKEKTENKIEDRKAIMKDSLSKNFAGEVRESSLVVSRDSIYVASRSSATRSDSTIPVAFQQIFLRFPGRYTLAALSERITKETRIPVTLSEELATQSGSTQSPLNVAINNAIISDGIPRPDRDPFAIGGTTSSGPVDVYRNTPNSLYAEEFELDFRGSLSELLDLVAAKGRISWEYKKGAIHFSKTITRTFFVNSLPGTTGTQRSIRASVGGAGTGSAPAGNGSISTSIEFDPLESVTQVIQTLMSQGGKMSANKSTGTITVTDLKENLDRIENIVELENSLLNRQVRVRVDFLSVRYNANAQAGIDLNVAFSRLNSNNDLAGVNVVPGGGLTGGDAGQASFRLTGTDFDATLLASALSTIGKTTILGRKAVTTLNRQSSPIVVSNQTIYLASTTPAPAGVNGGGGVPGLTPGTVNTGISMDVLPIITPDNTLIIQFALDISELIRIGSISTGSGPTLQQIQTPEVSAMSFLERVTMKNGETLVMVGYERDLSRTNGRDALTGLSSDGSEEREAFLISMTPYLD